MYDIHVHSVFSHDSECTLDKYAELIDAKKIQGIGFAEHVDYTPDGSGYGIFYYDKYYSNIMDYRNKGYKFYAGAEIGYFADAKKEILEKLRKEKYDYTISSVHRSLGYSLSTNRNIEYFRDNTLFRNILENYYESISSSIKVSEFDVIGHIGIYNRYLGEGFFENNSIPNIIKALESDLAKKLSVTDKIVEVNTSGLFSPSESTFPGKFFLSKYYEYGGELIGLSSDAHNAVKVGNGFNEAIEMLKKIGFKYYVLPWDKERYLTL